ncbi:MAG: adenylyl-sulfate kinase [Chloroflexi bacterium]|nr:adenylyl-sulfate kinase [Chloroflexota bacterium]
MSRLIAPYGGGLVNLLPQPGQQGELKAYAGGLPSLQLSDRSVSDLELLAVGAFSPLDRFMGPEDHARVVDEMRLAGGDLFPVPVTLPVERREELHLDRDISLRNAKNELLAILTVEHIYEWDRREVAARVFGTLDVRHPLLAEMAHWGELQISGRLRVLELPRSFDFPELRLTPAETRARLDALEASHVVAFQTLAPLHPAHDALIRRALAESQGTLLLHPIVGASRPGDAARHARISSYLTLLRRTPQPDRTVLNLLPLATRRAGPREALWQALVRRNYGADHMVVAQDHASPGLDSRGRPFYEPGAAQELVERHRDELGVGVVRAVQRVPQTSHASSDQSTDIRDASGRDSMGARTAASPYGVRAAPGNATQDGGSGSGSDGAVQLFGVPTDTRPRGFCVWFTGLSGSGKSTTAEVLTVLLLEHGREVTLLDGDVVRTHLSKGLGFSREDRDINVRRIGFVAAEIVRHGGVAVCAAVSPYRAARSDVRNIVGSERFIEVYVDTPIEVCEERDVKGMYAQARHGTLAGFTGVDDPYEPPRDPDVTLQTVGQTPQANARRVLDALVERGLLEGDAVASSSAATNTDQPAEARA